MPCSFPARLKPNLLHCYARPGHFYEFERSTSKDEAQLVASRHRDASASLEALRKWISRNPQIELAEMMGDECRTTLQCSDEGEVTTLNFDVNGEEEVPRY